MSRPFIRGQVAIDSMRDNGFLSAAHALAELIDNSIQAEADRVELVAFEVKKEASGDGRRATKRIDKIGVLDNGKGMTPETLHLALEFGASENRNDRLGIGKFGMGLPNSSISQCKHVEVWSWKSPSETYYTYLDIDEIKDGQLEQIPEPIKKEIPASIASAFGETLPKSGTFVLWSKIDRCQWKTGSSIYRHTQDIVGRAYRNFLKKDKVSIWFRAAELQGSIHVVGEEHKFLPNDPMYLMKNTSLPELPGEFKGESMFELCSDCDYEFKVPDENGTEQLVRITGSVLKRSVLEEIRKTTRSTIGHTEWGKHCAKNIGISVMRSGRELALVPEFIKSEAKDKGWARFYGIQIEFGPALDNIFGVTNNKQHVVNLRMMRPSEDYEREGFDSEQEYRSDLLANNDPKLRIYEIVSHIKEVESNLISRVGLYDLRGKAASEKAITGDSDVDIKPVNEAANEKYKKREQLHPTEAPSISKEELENELSGIGADNVEEKARTILDKQLQVWVEEIPMATTAFFDVSTKKGFTLLQINSKHVFNTKILSQVSDSQREALEICLAGWARMERECSSEKRLAQLEMARRDWGQLLDDYLEVDDES
ncbi:ATP-binding protein [Hydrocarboniclastica marina]|uniref:ATP-binding protein n=1 Tax=Hydrocarboniclastica marina TaxID=2259620 RepID=A0A4P7XKX5_9ALTE|nr:ATP-binding protein [Hydrocarboniclastica marina]QCF27483.1 ATP-binding protein [Hydrocarboniclastica marina]